MTAKIIAKSIGSSSTALTDNHKKLTTCIQVSTGGFVIYVYKTRRPMAAPTTSKEIPCLNEFLSHFPPKIINSTKRRVTNEAKAVILKARGEENEC